MATTSRPVIYAALGVLLIAAVAWSKREDPKPVAAPSKKAGASKTAEPEWNFPAADMALRFPKPTGALRNIFFPLINTDKEIPKPDELDQMKVPANLAEGEANWAYTGMVEVDGVRMALLENSSTHQAGYVKEGESWKKSRLTHITTASVTFTGPDGAEETVIRYNANQPAKPKPIPDGGFRPMDLGPQLKGMIGSNIEITPTGKTPRPITRMAIPVDEDGK